LSTPEPRSIGKVMCETRDAIERYWEAHAILADVSRRIQAAHPDGRKPGDAERFEWEMGRSHMKQREAELIRLVLAWRPSHAEMARGETPPPGWVPRGVLFEGITYILVRSARGEDDDDETCVPIAEADHLGPMCDMVWHLETAVADHLIDLDEAFGG